MTTDRPFDLAKLDFEGQRKQKRKRLLLISIAPVIVVLLFAVWLMVPTILTVAASNKFSQSEYAAVASDVSGLGFLNLIEPYKAYYNHGTALIGKGEYQQGIDRLERALAYVDDQETVCMITRNIVLGFEGLGDSELKQSKLSDAIKSYTKALNRLKDNSACDETALQKRLEEKLKAAESARSKQVSDKPDDQSESNQQEPSQNQQEKLKDLEQQATKDRNDSQDIDYDYDTLDPAVKPW